MASHAALQCGSAGRLRRGHRALGHQEPKERARAVWWPTATSRKADRYAVAKRPRWVKPQRDAMSAMVAPSSVFRSSFAGGIETEVKQIRQGRKSDELSKLIQEGALRHGAGGCQPCQRHFLADVGAHIGESVLYPVWQRALAGSIGQLFRSETVHRRNSPC